jgi:hypothetical protein
MSCTAMNEPAGGLRTLTLDVTLRAIEELRLPGWIGSTLHGALGTALAAATCSPACRRGHALGARPCAYSRLFVEPAAPGMREGVIAGMRPHPLVLRPPPPAEPRILAPGDRLAFGLTLIGRAIEDLGPLVAGLEGMAQRGLGKRRGASRLEKVESRGQLVFRPPRTLRGPEPDVPTSPPDVLHALRVRSATPLRLYREARPIRQPSFADLVEAALRRHDALAALNGEPVVPLLAPASKALDAARQVKVAGAEWRTFSVPRYSSRQKQKHLMAGAQGFAIYEGPIAPCWELLELATRIGIGKATSFGFGLIEIEPV